MAMDAHEIERMIKAALPDAAIEIKDLAGDGDHYAATVVSAAFKGKTRVQQHQMVYAALQGNMGGVLHALAPVSYTHLDVYKRQHRNNLLQGRAGNPLSRTLRQAMPLPTPIAGPPGTLSP